MGVALSAAALSGCCAHLAMLARWNRAYSLTAHRNLETMASKHVLDSLSVSPYMKGGRILDMGTGAGFPGVPLALSQPQRDFVLLDANGKKTDFVNHVIARLSLSNATAVQRRAQSFRPENGFDTIVCRAFGSLKAFAELARPMLLAGGRLVAMKGCRPDAEIEELDVLGEIEVVELSVSGIDVQRHAVIFE